IALPTPGFDTKLRAHVDLKALNPAVNTVMAFSGGDEQAQAAIDQVSGFGLIGADALSLSLISGFGTDFALDRFTLHNARQHAEALSIPTEPLGLDSVVALPADVYAGGVTRFSLASIDRAFADMREAGVPIDDGFDEIEEAIGIHPIDDVLEHLGSTLVYYISDATGGGSLTSLVMLVELDDADAFAGSIEQLTGFVNGLEFDVWDGPIATVRANSWNHGDREYTSLQFNGLAIPFEPTIAIANDWLIVGLTPQATIAATRQATGRSDTTIADNERFAEIVEIAREVNADPGGLIGFSFVDSRAMMRSGYPWLSFAASALSNGVRSFDGERDAGLIAPTFGELADDAMGTLQVVRWDGDDVVTDTLGDRSLLVRGTTTAGMISTAAPLFLPVLGAIGAESGALEDIIDELSWLQPLLPAIDSAQPRFETADVTTD
ncbi:MAG: hypothetical protein AAF747_06280, partial [Planctomycetota bacterium]